MTQLYTLKHNPEAVIVMYCGFGFNLKGEPDNAARALCFEVVA